MALGVRFSLNLLHLGRKVGMLSPNVCLQHPENSLRHVPCSARINIHSDIDSLYCVAVVDKHTDHPIPPQQFGKVPPFVKIMLQNKVVTNPNVGASALVMGTPERTAIGDKHPLHPGV